MPRPMRGSVTEHVGGDGRTYRSLRFQVGGRRHRIPLGPVSAEAAEEALRHTIADVERGTWTPPAAVEAPAEPEPIPTFHQYAEQWWLLSEGQLSQNTQEDYRWRLEKHLLAYFAEMPLDRIKAVTIERYIAVKLAEDDPLSARSINMTVILLGAILERAVRHELIGRNPAKGCRAKERAPARSYLETAGQIRVLLDAAGELDADAARDRRHVKRRAMIATLVFAGLRIGEMLSLDLDSIDLADGWLDTASKTDAGERKVKIRGALHDELASVKADAVTGQRLAFPTRTGRQMSPENFRSRVLAAAIKRANENLAAAGLPPLPGKITPHSLRRTFCSLLYALGEDPGTVMDEMGHTDPALALRVYRQAMRRGEGEKAQLRALVEGGGGASEDVASGGVVANSGQREQIEDVSSPAGETE